MGVEAAMWSVILASRFMDGEEDAGGFDFMYSVVQRLLSLCVTHVPGAADTRV